jgi:hypothetical protein
VRDRQAVKSTSSRSTRAASTGSTNGRYRAACTPTRSIGSNRAGARTIAFDVDFSSASNPAEDAKLAAALKRAGGGVVLPTFRQYAGSGSSEFTENVPIKSLAENAFLGAVNVSPDEDGAIRNMLLGVETSGLPRPSLPSLLAESKAEIGQSFEVDYSIQPGSIPRHSLVDLLEGKVAQESLRGKRVIIGATAIEMGDRYTVPGHGVIPGVVIQALAAETLLAGNHSPKLERCTAADPDAVGGRRLRCGEAPPRPDRDLHVRGDSDPPSSACDRGIGSRLDAACSGSRRGLGSGAPGRRRHVHGAQSGDVADR